MLKNLQIPFLTFIGLCNLYATPQSLYLGVIQSNDNKLSPLTHYYRGTSRLLIPHNGVATFEVSGDGLINNTMYLLITDQEPLPIAPKDTSGEPIYNTVEHLTVRQDAHYRFFTFEKTLNHEWIVKETSLQAHAPIPDDTIVIFYLPELLDRIEGGSATKLPTIYFNSCTDMLDAQVHNSDISLEQRIAKMQIAAINFNTIHTPLKQIHNKSNEKVLITLNV